jgi:hypothetical protein
MMRFYKHEAARGFSCYLAIIPIRDYTVHRGNKE